MAAPLLLVLEVRRDADRCSCRCWWCWDEEGWGCCWRGAAGGAWLRAKPDEELRGLEGAGIKPISVA